MKYLESLLLRVSPKLCQMRPKRHDNGSCPEVGLGAPLPMIPREESSVTYLKTRHIQRPPYPRSTSEHELSTPKHEVRKGLLGSACVTCKQPFAVTSVSDIHRWARDCRPGFYLNTRKSQPPKRFSGLALSDYGLRLAISTVCAGHSGLGQLRE